MAERKVTCETYTDRGIVGPRGKSAYEQAVDGGYTGTEEQFEELLASDLNTIVDSVTDINTVADNISDVNSVGQNISSVNTVADVTTDVSTVAGISSDVTQVAGIASAVSTVSNHDSEVTLVADNMASVMTTASNIGDVSTVAGISTDVSTVAGNNSNVTAVAGNATNINTVANNISNVNTVASNISDVNTVATNISDISNVNDNLTIIQDVSENMDDVIAAADAVEEVLPHITEINNVSDNISDVVTVAGINADVSAVASNSSNINTVSGNNTNITTVATNISNINAVASDLTNIDNASTYATNAANSATNAATSATNAQKWAEGTDADVQPLGGTKSSKGWAARAEEIVSTLGSVMHYKGSVATYADLPSSGQELGDVYNVISDGSNYAWDGTDWDAIGGAVDMSAYRTATQQDAIDATKQNKLTSSDAGTDIEIVTDQHTEIEQTVSGTSPLSLTDAKEDGLEEVKLFGGCEQSGTPTPTTPQDIISNNGVLKVRHASGLPLGYQMVEWLKPTGPIVITDFKTKSTQEIETVFYRERSGASYLYSSDTATGGATNTTAYLTSGAGNWRWDGKSYSIGVSVGIQFTSIQNKDGVWLNGTQAGWYSNAEDFVSTNDLRLSSGENTTVRIYSMTIREGETVTLDLVPVQRLSDSSYGFYDKVGGEFYTNAEATFVAGDVIDDTVDIYTDGTIETVQDSLSNTATAKMLLSVGNYKDIQSVLDGAVTRKVGVLVLDGTEEIWGTASQTRDITILSNCYTVAVPLGDAPIDKRRVYCTHLNSSDTLPDESARQGYALLGNGSAGTPAPLSNKYAVGLGLTTRFPTIAGLKQWLAQQYAAGTPVIVIYPLATPTTETVTPQTLQVQAGTNTITITQASLNNLTLEATYTKLIYVPLKINFKNNTGYTTNKGTVTKVNNTSPDSNGNVTITLPTGLPTQTGQSGKYLTTDGTDASWATVNSLPSQTGNSGKFLTTNGTTASWGNAIENKATGTNAVSIIGSATSKSGAVNIGNTSSAGTAYNVAIGQNASASGNNVSASPAYGASTAAYGYYASASAGTSLGSMTTSTNGVAIGRGYSTAKKIVANGNGSIAIGFIASSGDNCSATAAGAIQIGNGQNSTANTVQFNSYQILDASGKIPSARIPDLSATYVNQTDLQNAVNSVKRNVGEIVESTVPLTDAGLHLLDGSLLSGSGSYADFVTHMAGVYADHPELFTTEADWQTSVTNYGVCGKFVYDSVNNTVRLPKKSSTERHLVKSTVSGNDWCDVYSDGWCEQGGIDSFASVGPRTATINLLKPFNDENYNIFLDCFGSQGAPGIRISAQGVNSFTYAQQSAEYNYVGTKIFWEAKGFVDVSDLGSETTYQYIVIANSTKTEIEVDIDEIATDLNGKADVDLSNVSNTSGFRKLIEVYNNGTSWYKVYNEYDPSTGTFIGKWCEQGQTEITTKGTPVTVVFLKTFSTIPYCKKMRYGVRSITDNAAYSDFVTLTRTGFTSNQDGNSGNFGWYACGYID